MSKGNDILWDMSFGPGKSMKSMAKLPVTLPVNLASHLEPSTKVVGGLGTQQGFVGTSVTRSSLRGLGIGKGNITGGEQTPRRALNSLARRGGRSTVGGSSVSRTGDRVNPSGSSGDSDTQGPGKRPLVEGANQGGRTRMRTYDPSAPWTFSRVEESRVMEMAEDAYA